MKKVLPVYKNDGPLEGRFMRHRNLLKQITPPEALRHIERGAISPLLYMRA
jgi:hypothetical protein